MVQTELMEAFINVKQSGYTKAEKRERYDQINLDFFVPFVQEFMKSELCAGVHIMSVHYTSLIPK